MDLNSAALALIGTTPTHAQLLLVFKGNQGLCESYYRSYCRPNGLDPLEVKGIMWEALPIALLEWNPIEGTFATIWGKVVRRLAKRQSRASEGVGGMLVDHRTARTRGFVGVQVTSGSSYNLEHIVYGYNLESTEET